MSFSQPVSFSCLVSPSASAQLASLTEAQGLSEGVHTFDFGDGPFAAYIDAEGWMLWTQYHHQGGTNPGLHLIQPGEDLPEYDPCPLGCDLRFDLTKWGHGSQAFAAFVARRSGPFAVFIIKDPQPGRKALASFHNERTAARQPAFASSPQ